MELAIRIAVHGFKCFRYSHTADPPSGFSIRWGKIRVVSFVSLFGRLGRFGHMFQVPPDTQGTGILSAELRSIFSLTSGATLTARQFSFQANMFMNCAALFFDRFFVSDTQNGRQR